MVVELEPLFYDLFLGGRRYALTASGAERARSVRRGFVRCVSTWQRILLIAVILALARAVLLL